MAPDFIYLFFAFLKKNHQLVSFPSKIEEQWCNEFFTPLDFHLNFHLLTELWVYYGLVFYPLQNFALAFIP